MRQQQAFRGFIFILLMLILIVTTMGFPYARQTDKVTNQDFIKIPEDDQAANMNIHQNPQIPAGEAVLIPLDGQVKRLYVLNVKDAQRLLNAHDMVYVTMDVPQENYLVIIILPFMLSIVVVVIIIMAINRSAGGGGANARMTNFGKNRARMSRDNKVDFSNVVGLMEEKEKLEEVMDFFKNPQKYTNVGARISRGLLLVGPPRADKTLSARAVAGEAGAPFFSMSGSNFAGMFVGVGASRVCDLSEEVKKNSPCIVFIDGIDAVVRHRGTGMGSGYDEREQMLSQLLVEMDGFGVNEGIIVMAVTDRVDILDPATLRPGRFDRKVAVGHPDAKGREEILKVHSKEKLLSEDAGLHGVAQTTSGFMGADLENLMNEAVIISARDNRRSIKQSDINQASVKMGIGAEKESRVIPEKDKKIAVCHKAGHAILFRVFPNAGPVHTVSITPTGIGTAGYTMPLPRKNEMFNIKGRMMQNIMVDLGGRIAEEPVLGDITTGASQDIRQATQIIRIMVTQYGMPEEVGVIQYGSDENRVSTGRDLAHIKSHGNEVVDTIDSEVKRIIDECYQKVKDTVKQYDYVLHTCVTLLIEKEKISQSEFETLFTPTQQHLGLVFRAGNDGKQHQEGKGG